MHVFMKALEVLLQLHSSEFEMQEVYEGLAPVGGKGEAKIG